MQTVDVVIVGGGLSGLYAAWLLEHEGVRSYRVLEGRDTPGGRIHSLRVAGVAGSFDLGPTWFWPEIQPELDRVISDLGLQRFAQYQQGDTIFERGPTAAPMRLPGYTSAPASMRLRGGMGALIEALLAGVNPTSIVTGQNVRRARKIEHGVEIDSETALGEVRTWRARHLLLALPPRLAEASIAFSPALPQDMARQWRTTATWMAPHAKYIAVYRRPFWRDQGLSGSARSVVGVLGEIHDASLPGGGAALFGFFQQPSHVRACATDEVLRTHCRAQLGRLFGSDAAAPVDDYIQDWAREPFTSTTLDQTEAGQHASAPITVATKGEWCGCMTGIASEWSPQFPGYVAGAIEAARIGVRGLSAQETPQ